MPVALEAAEVAAQEGRSLQVVDLRSIVPFDDETVCAAVRSTGRAVVVAEASGFASVSSEIVARVTERCFHSLAAPIRRVTGFDIPYPPPKLEHFQLPGVDRVLDAVDDLQWERVMSTRDFLLPDLGEGLTEAEIVRWLVAEGDVVAVDQSVVEVETAKSLVEVPSPFAGRIVTLHGAPGRDRRRRHAADHRGRARRLRGVRRGRGLPRGGEGRLRQRADRLRDRPEASGGGRRRRPRQAAPAARCRVATVAAPARPRVPLVISPLVRRLARDLGIDLHALDGTGRGGAITRGDVERHVAGRANGHAAARLLPRRRRRRRRRRPASAVRR